MNGKDGKPFKTREGGVMRLETLISEITEKMYEKISENHSIEEKKQNRQQNSSEWQQLNTEICQTRHQKIMYLT